MSEYIEILILFISEYGYIKTEDFIQFAYSNIDEYEKILDGDTYLSLLSVSLADKESVIDLTGRLREFAQRSYASDISRIDSDAYVERIVGSDRDDYTARCLRKLFVRRERAQMDLGNAKTVEDIIKLIKQCIILPSWCGDGWNAMYDLLGEGDFPIVLEVKNMDALEQRLPQDAAILKSLLNKKAPEYCTVKYIDDH